VTNKKGAWKFWAVAVALIMFAPSAVQGISSSLVSQANTTGRGVICGVHAPANSGTKK
jgi:hypothetical protein